MFEFATKFARTLARGGSRGIGGIATGFGASRAMGDKARAVDFYDLRGDIEAMLAGTRAPVSFASSRRPTRAASRPERRESCVETGRWLASADCNPEVENVLDLTYSGVVFRAKRPRRASRACPSTAKFFALSAVRATWRFLLDAGIPVARFSSSLAAARLMATGVEVLTFTRETE